MYVCVRACAHVVCEGLRMGVCVNVGCVCVCVYACVGCVCGGVTVGVEGCVLGMGAVAYPFFFHGGGGGGCR